MVNSNERKGFFFYKSFLDMIRMIKDEKAQLDLFKAIAEYGIYGKTDVKSKNEMVHFAWITIEPTLKSNWGKYLNGCAEKKRKRIGAPKVTNKARKEGEDEEVPF